MNGYRNIFRPHWESNHDSSFVRPKAQSQYSSCVYGTCCERAKYRLSALQKGFAVGRTLLLRLLWVGSWLPQGRYASLALPISTSHLCHAQVSQLGLRTNGTRIRFRYPLHIYRAIERRRNSYISLTTCHPFESGPMLRYTIMASWNSFQSPRFSKYEKACC